MAFDQRVASFLNRSLKGEPEFGVIPAGTGKPLPMDDSREIVHDFIGKRLHLLDDLGRP